MRKGLLTCVSWWGRRWFKDYFWDKERVAEQEEIRRVMSEQELREACYLNTQPLPGIGPPRGEKTRFGI